MQTFTFAQGVGVDSVKMVNVLPDTCFNNTIADSVKLKSVPFETIEREGGKYYAVTSDGHKEEITSFINGRKRVMVKDGDGHELVIDKDGNVMGVERSTRSAGGAPNSLANTTPIAIARWQHRAMSSSAKSKTKITALMNGEAQTILMIHATHEA